MSREGRTFVDSYIVRFKFQKPEAGAFPIRCREIEPPEFHDRWKALQFARDEAAKTLTVVKIHVEEKKTGRRIESLEGDGSGNVRQLAKLV
jgi:hypothetical protein